MIIVEGFDASGKSTLANRIGQLLSWPVLHTGGPTADEFDVRRCILRSAQRMQKKCVQDRITHISESVYSMLYRPEKAAIALDAIRHIPPTVTMIYCRPPKMELLQQFYLSHARKSHDDDEHMARIQATAPHLIDVYDTVMALVSIRVEVHMVDRYQPEQIDNILKTIEERYL